MTLMDLHEMTGMTITELYLCASALFILSFIGWWQERDDDDDDQL
jgi:hypothetical protein